MGRKLIAIALAMFAFGFGPALRSNAGTETIEPYRAPAPAYNYAPPPRVYYAPPVVGFAVYPAFFHGPRFRVFGVRRFPGPRAHFRHHHWR